ncbi:MAG: PSD1 and planctomycete cytochrome C domain-containing protein [Verrucomicrobiota bacterium]|nr:PSD1 and planctomycete cytochrome C domain-containing protein [Verrucomicrobiota bacterium]
MATMFRVFFITLSLGWVSFSQAAVSFNRDVLPILAGKCFACHGADQAERKAGLRLDEKVSAYKERDGVVAVVPSKPEVSELVSRIFSKDPDEVMPPPDEVGLTEAEKATLRQWISEDAVYEKHWAFETPEKPRLPIGGKWGRGEIDRFVFQRMTEAGLSPQRSASRETIIRRVTLDLTGVPPTLGEVDRFLNDTSPGAYGRVVDRLLESPRFGERMAVWWLDGARYGDSHGYDNDLENSQWPWRNWVIEAFNENMPYDQFTVEQLAGDLLPDATGSQVLATGFNRNHRINTEGGALDEEWRTEYVIDRVQTMGSVWMGLTLSCARCHDHKYDPISQREFYQLFALFNNLDEKGFINNLRGSAEPRIRYKNSEYEQRKKNVEASEENADNRKAEIGQLDAEYPFVMIMRDNKPRKAFILERGQYDAPGEEVQPGLMSTLSAVPGDMPMNRLALARWLTDGQHPLTARVLVNRLWEQLFGVGIVKSSENLGVQTDWPSHPKLLDWLAVDFVEDGWNIKRLLRQVVMSATYRQDAVTSAERLRLDPKNRLLSRGPRTRLAAEMVRDQALFLSGLIVEKHGGPSMWVYQPVGLWREVEKRGTFKQDHGEKLYRRSLYSRIRRTVAHPSMLLFDAPSREVCTVKRTHTNTPLQALALMNEVTYVEASRKFSERIMANGATPKEGIAWAFRAATARQPEPAELALLTAGYERRLARFRAQPKEAEQLLDQGESPSGGAFGQAELAAMVTVANVLLNLDELINK